jgi:hypothetical protein
VPALGHEGARDAEAIEDERRASRRTSLHFLGACAFSVALAAIFFVAGYRIGLDVALVVGWFCGAFGLAWWIAAAAHRIPFFARWTVRTLALYSGFRPSSLLAATLWLFIFHGGLILAIRTFGP